jgi:hypothetical protein
MSVIPRVGMKYLNALLPSGWEKFFNPRRAGAYYGLSITCPICHETPPRELRGNRRWRWLAAHQATEHQ